MSTNPLIGAQHVEGPKEAPICDSSGAYVGLVAGHRDECADCGKRVKVVRHGRLATHRAWPRNGSQDGAT